MEKNNSKPAKDRIPDRRRQLYTDAKTSWGLEAQLNKAAEEFAELAAALNRDLNNQQDREELLQEMADARLMLEQLEHSLFDTVFVDDAIQQAAEDLRQQLNESGVNEGSGNDDS